MLVSGVMQNSLSVIIEGRLSPDPTLDPLIFYASVLECKYEPEDRLPKIRLPYPLNPAVAVPRISRTFDVGGRRRHMVDTEAIVTGDAADPAGGIPTYHSTGHGGTIQASFEIFHPISVYRQVRSTTETPTAPVGDIDALLVSRAPAILQSRLLRKAEPGGPGDLFDVLILIV